MIRKNLLVSLLFINIKMLFKNKYIFFNHFSLSLKFFMTLEKIHSHWTIYTRSISTLKKYLIYFIYFFFVEVQTYCIYFSRCTVMLMYYVTNVPVCEQLEKDDDLIAMLQYLDMPTNLLDVMTSPTNNQQLHPKISELVKFFHSKFLR